MDPEHDQLDTLAKRIKYVRGRQSREKFAQILGYHQGSIFNFEKGRNKPTAKFINILCFHCNINSEWLLTGQGPIWKGPEPDNETLWKTIMDTELCQFDTVAERIKYIRGKINQAHEQNEESSAIDKEKIIEYEVSQLDTLAKRIKHIRGKMTQDEFAQSLDVHRSSIVRYEKGLGKPNTDFVDALHNHYDVNPLWLVSGKGPIKEPVEDKEILKGVVERLGKVIDKQGATKLAENSGIGSVALAAYMKGCLSPSVVDLLKISKAYDVSLDWLLEGENSHQAYWIDVDTFEDIYIKLETTLNRHNRRVSLGVKAQIFSSLFELYAGTGKEINVSTIERLLALAPSPDQEIY